MLKLVLVRHGETEWNVQRRYQGQTDIPLSMMGMKQAELVAARLVDEKFDAIYASDLKRAWQTASYIAEKIELPISAEPRLREMAFGVLEGLTWDEAKEKYPDMLNAWLGDYNQAPEGGEGLDAFSERILSCRDDLLAKHDRQRILRKRSGGGINEILLLVKPPVEKKLI